MLRAAGGEGRLLDVQWATEHLETLGARAVSRPTYLGLLEAALDRPAVSWSTTRAKPE